MQLFSTYPEGRLSAFVPKIFYRDLSGMQLPPKPIRVFPDGCMEIVIQFGDGLVLHTKNQEQQFNTSYFRGLIENYALFERQGNLRFFGIKLFPWAAASLLGCSSSELARMRFSLDQLAPRLTSDLEMALFSVKDPFKGFDIIEDYLNKRLKNCNRLSNCDTFLQYALGHIYQAGGNIKLANLAAEMGMSSRYFRKKFQEASGFSPKKVAKNIRLHRLIDLYRKEGAASLTQLAYSCGYFDQSHFIREFKEIGGLRPKDYFRLS